MPRLAGKNVFVTGSSRGIGKGCILEMAKEGANVAINYHSHKGEAEMVANEAKSFGVKAIVLGGDVSDRVRVEAMIAETADAFGSLDCFVSNAVYSDRQLMIEADLDGFKKTIDVGMWGAFYGLRGAALQMVKQGKGGSIVVISSPHAVLAIPTAMAYNMAKAAIDHMARTASVELAPHRIRVNIVHPGWIDTPGERKFFTEEQLEQGGKALPWKRLGRPDEVGKAVAFVSSDDAEYMTGGTLTVDGGVGQPWWSNRAEGARYRTSIMSTTEILRELPNLSRTERRAILNRLIELDEDAEVLEERRQQADEAFQMLDEMEAADAESEAR